MADPRSLRTFNPGAMNYGPFAQRHGAIGTDGRLAIFPDMQTGFNAMSGLLDTYRDKHGLNSINGIINRWAPRQYDNNSTDAYIRTVSSKLGIDPNAPIPPEMRPKLMEAMASYEAGRPVTMNGQPAQAALSKISLLNLDPSAASPMPSPTPGPQPMAQPTSPGQPQPSGFDEFLGRWQNPMTQQGLGILLAAMQNGDLNAGASSGAARGNQALQQYLAMQKHKQEQAKMQAIQQALGQSETLQGLTPGDRALMSASPESAQNLILAGAKQKLKAQEAEEFGKSGAIFQGPDGRFYSMQFGSRGERVVKPVEADGKPLSPAKGVKQVGDELIDMATGNPTRNVAGPIANEKTAEEIGRGRGKTIAGAPKLMATQADLERQHSVVNDDIERAMKEIDWKSVGIVGGLTKAIPGSPAYALAQKIATIKANVGFDKLAEMRANSPTGGALGAVTERELAFLQSVFGSLEQAQDADEIRYNLRRLKDYLKDSSASRRRTLEAELKAAGIGAEGTLEGRVGTREAPPPPAAPAAGGWGMKRLD